MKPIELVGQRSGRWTVIQRASNTSAGQAQWLCRCDCGNEKTLKSIIIRREISRSCGCLKSETTTTRSTKHGHSSSKVISPTYYSWAGMWARCTNPKHAAYKRYGGRGITVCKRWEEFANFLADMGEKPPGTSIDRINNSKGYTPSNCQWKTSKQQGRNKSNNRILVVGSDSKTLAEWSESYGIDRKTITDRISYGWSADEAVKAKPLKIGYKWHKRLGDSQDT